MKNMKERTTTKWLACYLALAIFAIGFCQQAYAGFAPSQVVNLGSIDRTEDLQKIQNVLESKMVGERLKQLGFTAEEIKGKLSYLSDDQIHQLAIKLDELRVGGFHGAIVFIAVVAIAAILLIALIPWHH